MRQGWKIWSKKNSYICKLIKTKWTRREVPNTKRCWKHKWLKWKPCSSNWRIRMLNKIWPIGVYQSSWNSGAVWRQRRDGETSTPIYWTYGFRRMSCLSRFASTRWSTALVWMASTAITKEDFAKEDHVAESPPEAAKSTSSTECARPATKERWSTRCLNPTKCLNSNHRTS
jgi:hypothetical protein